MTTLSPSSTSTAISTTGTPPTGEGIESMEGMAQSEHDDPFVVACMHNELATVRQMISDAQLAWFVETVGSLPRVPTLAFYDFETFFSCNHKVRRFRLKAQFGPIQAGFRPVLSIWSPQTWSDKLANLSLTSPSTGPTRSTG